MLCQTPDPRRISNVPEKLSVKDISLMEVHCGETHHLPSDNVPWSDEQDSGRDNPPLTSYGTRCLASGLRRSIHLYRYKSCTAFWVSR